MWTKQHRVRHEPQLKEMVSRGAEKQVAQWLERADPPRSEAATPTLAVVRAIAWHLRVGGPWRALPSHMAPWRTVYGWFRRWLDLGLFNRLMCEVAMRRRRVAGRRPTPTLGIIDTQTVKCIPVRGPRGNDAAKLTVGGKRVVLAARSGRACGWRSSTRPLPLIAAANGRTSMACATTWSAASLARRALSCCPAVGRNSPRFRG